MSRIFISYSREDEDFARRLATSLSDAGADIWLDVNAIPAGMKWSTAIQQGLDACEVLLVILSPDSMASENVEDEWQYFKDEGKPIIPVLLREAKVHFQLRRLQYIDFLNQAFDVALSLLVMELQSKGLMLNAESSVAPVEVVEVQEIVAPPSDVGTPPDLSDILPPPFEWCYVPSGYMRILPMAQHVKGFFIAKYPITRAQYREFVTNHGYKNTTWWDFSEEALKWHQEHPDPPSRPPSSQANVDDVPQSKLTWYEAVAFTFWLSWKANAKISLPRAVQWKRAAQDENYAFPWITEFDPDKANTYESGIGGLTPVTAYPQGASPFGVMDTMGNVWEWCLTDSESYEDDLNGSGTRILQGGSWFHKGSSGLPYSHMRPDRRGAYGFRIMYNLSASEVKKADQ